MIKFIFVLIFSLNSYAHTFNVRTNPLTFLIGAKNLELNYALGDKLSIGFGGLHWQTELAEIEFDATETHLRLDYWFNKSFEQGHFIGLQVSQINMSLTAEIDDVDYDGDISSQGYLAHYGYHWQWDNFNIALGTYLGVYNFDKEIKLEDANGNREEKSIPAFGAWGVEFFTGWAF